MKLSPRRAPAREAMGRWVDSMAGIPVVVWGDFLLDEYLRCRSSRVSREAPVLVLEYETRSVQGGGAANAALNLAAMGAQVSVVGWVGRDPAGGELRDMLERARIDTQGLLEHDSAATVVKTRVVAGSPHVARQQVVRIDRGVAFTARARERSRLLATVRARAAEAHAVVLSDYGYDSLTPELARRCVREWRSARQVVALDARYRLAEYRDVTIATPNESEAAAAVARPIRSDAELARVAVALRRRLRAEHLIVTRGRDGLTLWSAKGGTSLAAWGGEEAVDVTGAGDAVVAAAALALAAGAPPFTAAAIANLAGSVAVSRRGAVAVRRSELKRALRRREAVT